ncbi:ribonuclease D [Geopsychrobacter electrodiphilus]|uniref:ribonuclease D n=1 Tax=Geopsychrobacter electrodiphilus TaxID=225196 RepID=UPI000374BA84|nr:HRDC domain-containing protein [Geopsychrobacter electrodiphilus]
MPLPQILTRTAEVEELAAELSTFPQIAVDLEADSMHHYQEKVCLLQFTAGEQTILLDPLDGADLSSLRPVLANPGIRKLFHAADYDIRCLARDFSIQIYGLFDTMISSQFLGEAKFGLADVLGKYFGLEVDKKYQRADWTIRPISPEMVRYAAGDTRYLADLVVILEEKLHAMGRRDWVAEEFALLEKARFAEPNGLLCLRVKGAGKLTRRQLGLLEELLQWRNAEAQRRDLPHFKVLGTASLLHLATQAPSSVRGLVAIEGISPRLVERYGKALMQAVEQGVGLDEADLPAFPRVERREKDPAADKRFLQLKDWRKKTAAQLALDPGVLINNATLEQVARANPQSRAELEGLGALKNWQLRELGTGMLQAL